MGEGMKMDNGMQVRRTGWVRVLVPVLVWLAAAGQLPAASAQGWGDAAAGREIADRWCAACHLVAPDQQQASADVPSFMEIARAVEGDFAVLEGFLIDPHPPMPDMSLTRQEIRDIIAYFGTLE
jgi:mono/diheme cytochrome c family protein